MTNASSNGQPRRIALLIDAENIGASSELVESILRGLKKYGRVEIRHIYGDWSKPALKGWQNVALEYRLQQQHFGSIPGKNSSDVAMVIGAMDILYRENVDGFCLVTSDSDFTPLAMRIRHEHKGVIGVGRRNTHSNFVAACNLFVYLEDLLPEPPKSPEIQNLVPPSPAVPPPVPVAPVTPQNTGTEPDKQKVAELYALAEEAMKLTGASNGWVTLAEFGSRLRQAKADFNPGDYYEGAKLRPMLETYPELFEVKPVDKDVMIRLIGKKAASPKKLTNVAATLNGQDKKAADLYELAKKAMNLTSTPTGWITLSELGTRLRQVKSDFSVRDYRETGGFSELFQAYPKLFQMKKQGTVDMIKLR